MVSPISRLLAALDLEEDERAAVSVIYDVAADEPELRHASVLFGPPEMSDVTWPEWNRQHVQAHAEILGARAFPPTFVHEQSDVVIGRTALASEEASSFLEGCLTGHAAEVGQLPVARVNLGLPEAQIRVFPHLSTPAGFFIRMLSRPLTGFFFPIADAGRDLAPAFSHTWTVDGQSVHRPDLWHVGISIGGSGAPSAPPGLLVGRVERPAWLREMRGAGSFEVYHVSLGFDPSRISPYELVIELQEWTAGELAVARRIPLEWLDLSNWSSEDHIDLFLPILGRSVLRSVSLYDLGGLLRRARTTKGQLEILCLFGSS